MTHPQALDLIKSKCREDGGCWIWLGALQQCGTTPTMRIPGTRKTTGVRRLVLQCCGIDTRGKLATNTCESPLCVAPEHQAAVTRKKLQAKSASLMPLSSKVQRNAKTAKRMRQQAKLTTQIVELLPASRLPVGQLARFLGVDRQTIWRATSGRSWVPAAGSNPFAGLMR